MTNSVPEQPEPVDKLVCLDALMQLLAHSASRRAFQSDPWGALEKRGIPHDKAPWQFVNFVGAIAEYSDDELRLLGSFGARVYDLMGPEEWMF